MTKLAGLIAAPLVVLGLLFVVILTGGGACGPGAGPSTVAGGTVAGYSGEQLANAKTIINTIAGRKLSTQAQVVAIAAAMGESSLVNVGYGDDTNGVTNPDGTPTCSLGLFQQQWCLGWGTADQVRDPVYATNAFVDALVKVSGWETLPVTIAINRVQGNADPNHYAKYEQPARDVVSSLTGTTVQGPVQCKAAGGGNYVPASGAEPGPWGGFSNGEIPTEQLTTIPWDSRMFLRQDAAASLIAMNADFRLTFGFDIPLNDAYRTYAQQVIDKQTYGDGAAEPGTSNHGWAMAVDIGDPSHMVIGYDDAIYAWLKANAGRYGWKHPDWAEPDGRGPHEAWHWEYWGMPAAA